MGVIKKGVGLLAMVVLLVMPYSQASVEASCSSHVFRCGTKSMYAGSYNHNYEYYDSRSRIMKKGTCHVSIYNYNEVRECVNCTYYDCKTLYTEYIHGSCGA